MSYKNGPSSGPASTSSDAFASSPSGHRLPRQTVSKRHSDGACHTKKKAMYEQTTGYDPQPDLSQKTGTGPVRTRLPFGGRPATLQSCRPGRREHQSTMAWRRPAAEAAWAGPWIGRKSLAWPFHGRVCYHPPKRLQPRSRWMNAVSIHAIERFLGDEATGQGWQPAPPAPPAARRCW